MKLQANTKWILAGSVLVANLIILGTGIALHFRKGVDLEQMAIEAAAKADAVAQAAPSKPSEPPPSAAPAPRPRAASAPAVEGEPLKRLQRAETALASLAEKLQRQLLDSKEAAARDEAVAVIAKERRLDERCYLRALVPGSALAKACSDAVAIWAVDELGRIATQHQEPAGAPEKGAQGH